MRSGGFYLARKEKHMDLYQGENYGVFTVPNGYYVARIAVDRIGYSEALSGGNGWSDDVLEQCNTQAAELDSMAAELDSTADLLAAIPAEA
jgi:hypothetical protein